MDITCKKCGKPREKGRRLCKECIRKEGREKSRRWHKLHGRYNYGKGNCSICGNEITLWKKDQLFCRRCANISTSKYGNVSNNYERGRGKGYCFMHRRIAETMLGRRLRSDELIHHIDENPNNNDPKNLIVIGKSLHARLHQFLRKQRAELAKANYENLENCWESLRASTTTAWLETTNAKVIKLWEIGQSAAEPPEKEEGSETMHKVP